MHIDAELCRRLKLTRSVQLTAGDSNCSLLRSRDSCQDLFLCSCFASFAESSARLLDRPCPYATQNLQVRGPLQSLLPRHTKPSGQRTKILSTLGTGHANTTEMYSSAGFQGAHPGYNMGAELLAPAARQELDLRLSCCSLPAATVPTA